MPKDEGSLIARLIYDKLGIRKPWVVRGVVGFLYGLLGGSCAFIYSREFCFYFGYCVLNFVLNALGEYFKMKDYVVEPLAGIGVGTIVFLI